MRFLELTGVDITSNQQTLSQQNRDHIAIMLNVDKIEAVYHGLDGRACVRTASGGVLYVRETYDEVQALIQKMEDSELDDIMYGVHPE